MKQHLHFILAVLVLFSLAACNKPEAGQAKAPAVSPCEGINQLTEAEKTAGWVLLFDGKTLNGWHAFNAKPTQSWIIEDCAMKTAGTEGNYGSDKRADMVTDREYENFEIAIDWKTTKGGNSGLMYGVVEDAKYDAPWKKIGRAHV
jgi:hypothetical protein